MNLAKLSLFVCPAIVTATLLLVNPAIAVEIAPPSQVVQVDPSQINGHWLPVNSRDVVSDPEIPRGCTCSRCLQATQLQGRLPGL